MANLTPLQLIQMVKNKNPRAVAEEIISQYYPNDPMMQSILQMAQQGNNMGVKQFAQQLLQQQGLDLNSEMGQMFTLLSSMGK